MSKIPTHGQLNIVIEMPTESGGSLGETADGGTPSPANPVRGASLSSNPVSSDSEVQTAKLVAVAEVVKTVGKQALNTAVSNIGLATGNAYLQQRVETGLEFATSAVSLAVTASNPVAFSITAAGMAISAGSQIYREYKERERENYVATQYARRAGFTENRQ